MNEAQSTAILQRLKGVGLRPTRQRVALAGLLFRSDDRHVTAEQLHQEALGESVRVSLATVYNTLHQFTNGGLLREVVVEAGRSYFDRVREALSGVDEATASAKEINDLKLLYHPSQPWTVEDAKAFVRGAWQRLKA